MITIYRKITPHLPKAVLYALCRLSVPLYYVYKVPVIGTILRTILPISHQPEHQLRILRHLTITLQNMHAFIPEVFEWFSEAGFVDITIKNPPIFMYGRLPRHDDST